MANTKKNEINTQETEAPRPKTDVAKGAASNDERAADTLAGMQTALSLNTSGFSQEDGRILRNASVARYREFAPVDATERVLATMAVGLQNGAMRSLQVAAEVECPDVRNDEMRNATRAAKVVAELLETLDRHRGRRNQDVRVGQVTVASGGQAVVGNVNAEGRQNTKPEEPDDQTGGPSCAKE